MFDTKGARRDLANYIGARVSDDENTWLRAEMRRRKLTMSDLIRTALATLRSKS